MELEKENQALKNQLRWIISKAKGEHLSYSMFCLIQDAEHLLEEEHLREVQGHESQD